MSKTYDVAVVGATGMVGEAIIEILQERDFPVATLYPLASSRSAGTRIAFRDKHIMVKDLAEFDFSQVQLALFSAGGEVSAEYVPKATAAGCIVIDNTACFRYDDDVPLVVPEVNPQAIADYTQRNIIANPNCSTTQMVVALKPIHDEAGLSRINVATYQAVSGSGKQGINELATQTANLLNAKPIEPKVYSKQIAFNVIPHIDVFQDNGYSKEEMKMVWETRKIFNDDAIMVNSTAVRVPVFFGHAEAVHIETRDKITAQRARELLEQASGVEVIDNCEENDYPTSVSDASGGDMVYVGRIREDISHPRGLDLWIVADNIRKGAALNSVQIAEILVKHYL